MCIAGKPKAGLADEVWRLCSMTRRPVSSHCVLSVYLTPSFTGSPICGCTSRCSFMPMPSSNDDSSFQWTEAIKSLRRPNVEGSSHWERLLEPQQQPGRAREDSKHRAHGHMMDRKCYPSSLLHDLLYIKLHNRCCRFPQGGVWRSPAAFSNVLAAFGTAASNQA